MQKNNLEVTIFDEIPLNDWLEVHHTINNAVAKHGSCTINIIAEGESFLMEVYVINASEMNN